MIENRAVGIKSREVYEAPGAMTLIAAHSALEDVVLPRRTRRGSSARSSSAGRRSSTRVAGLARTRGDRRLRRRHAGARHRRSPDRAAAERSDRDGAAVAAHDLRHELASYGTGETFPHDAAEGFIASPRSRPSCTRLASAPRSRRDDLGRAGRGSSTRMWAFLRADDAELLPYDCEATAEHARRLAAAGLLTDEELDEAESRLARSPRPGWLPRVRRGRALGDRALLGDVGRKIHAGRSRNDQAPPRSACTSSTPAPRRATRSTGSRSWSSRSQSPRRRP